MNSKYKKILPLAGMFLVALNIFAFYILKKGIEINDQLEHVEEESVRKSLEQKQIFTDVFPSLVFTIDIAIIFFLLYLLIKFLFKSIKKSISTK